MGLRPDEFWSLTLREYSRECAAWSSTQRDTYNRDLTQAWHTIRYLKIGWQKKLPDLQKEYLKEPTSGAVHQTPGQMKGIMAMLGYQIKPVSDEAKKATRLGIN